MVEVGRGSGVRRLARSLIAGSAVARRTTPRIVRYRSGRSTQMRNVRIAG
jgi:hypothetical protein